MANDSVSWALPWPPATNSLYATVGTRRVLSAKGRAYHRDIAQAIMVARAVTAWPGHWLDVRTRLRVTCALTAPTRVAYDLDGRVKALLDALGVAHAGVYGDDRQIDELILRRCPPARPGSVLVTIMEI